MITLFTVRTELVLVAASQRYFKVRFAKYQQKIAHEGDTVSPYFGISLRFFDALHFIQISEHLENKKPQNFLQAQALKRTSESSPPKRKTCSD